MGCLDLWVYINPAMSDNSGAVTTVDSSSSNSGTNMVDVEHQIGHSLLYLQ